MAHDHIVDSLNVEKSTVLAGATRFSEVGQKQVTMRHSKVRRSLKHRFK
ncbi:hypothetical protein H6G04_05125 [Calothrix membranacea FACHB-236]|nr:hypothetical protein [Calothrix membranacea FACHB-236]